MTRTRLTGKPAHTPSRPMAHSVYFNRKNHSRDGHGCHGPPPFPFSTVQYRIGKIHADYKIRLYVGLLPLHHVRFSVKIVNPEQGFTTDPSALSANQIFAHWSIWSAELG